MEFRKFEFTEFFYFRKHKFPSKKFQIPKLIFRYEISGKIPFQEKKFVLEQNLQNRFIKMPFSFICIGFHVDYTLT